MVDPVVGFRLGDLSVAVAALVGVAAPTFEAARPFPPVVPPFGRLKYLYVGTADYAKDAAYYLDVLGAERVWEFHEFDAWVGAFRLGEGPLVLLADHRPPKTVIQIYVVERLEACAKTLRARGWKEKGERFEVPDGPCYLFADPTGNEYALLEPSRGEPLEHASERGGRSQRQS